MIINLQRGTQCQAQLTIEIPAEDVAAARAEVSRQFYQHVRIPGYRPGKAPKKLVEKRFQSGIKEELEKRLVSHAFDEAKKKEELHILQVQSRQATPNVDETYTISADLLVAPEFELPEYKGIPLALPSEEIREDHLEKIIDRWKEQNADYDEEPEGTALAMGHYAVADYQGTRDGERIGDDDSPMLKVYFDRQDAWVFMDEETLLPGFCGEMLDKKAGEEFTFNLTLPEDFPDEDLKAQEVTFAVTIKRIMKKTLPEFTDEKVSESTNEEIKTVDEFKENASKGLKEKIDAHLDDLRMQQCLEHLHGLLNFDLPKEMVDQETQQHVNRIVNENQRQGIDTEKLLENEDNIVNIASRMGERDVKTKFILNEIATAEGINVNDNEVFNRVGQLAASARISPKKAVRILRENGQLHSIAEEILFGKALDFVKENASVSTDEANNALDQIWEAESS